METETDIQRQHHCSRFELRSSYLQQTAPQRKIQNLNLGRLLSAAECLETFKIIGCSLLLFSYSRDRNTIEKNSFFDIAPIKQMEHQNTGSFLDLDFKVQFPTIHADVCR